MTRADWNQYLVALIGSEFSRITRYYDRVVQYMPRAEDSGLLLRRLDCPRKQALGPDEAFPDLSAETGPRTAILINGTLNYHFDIQGLLMQLKPSLSRSSRLLVVLYNPYLRWAYQLAGWLGFRNSPLPETFVTRASLEALAHLGGYAIVRHRFCGYCPFRWLGLGDWINRLLPLIPLLRWLCFTYLVVLRPVIADHSPGLSCVIPARNERGNIENALKRFPDLGCPVEIIFVEGHSSDGTWEEIQRVAAEWSGRFQIQMFQQTGRGKADAVRLGFAHARQPLWTILDADLTMPPETLGRFYRAYCEGKGDFINGSRLVYPMEGDAMRFLNRLGNLFFARALSWVLETQLGDSLCGTKLMSGADYRRFVLWRGDFGDFDPFGDFELIFPAAELGLGSIDIPVRYLARTYGSTQISRFRNGWQLLRMTAIGFWKIKLGVRRAAKEPVRP